MTTLGWECPRCHRCYAPSITQCPHCGGNYQGSGVIPPLPPYPPYIVTWGSGSVTTDGTQYVTVNLVSDTKENNA